MPCGDQVSNRQTMKHITETLELSCFCILGVVQACLINSCQIKVNQPQMFSTICDARCMWFEPTSQKVAKCRFIRWFKQKQICAPCYYCNQHKFENKQDAVRGTGTIELKTKSYIIPL